MAQNKTLTEKSVPKSTTPKTEEKTALKAEEAKKTGPENKAGNKTAAEADKDGNNYKLPWELIFLFVIMGLMGVIIVIKAFGLI
ncbi:MAG: hypothetical protein ACM3S2_06090 [Ignavibacteriales bacterium]